MYLIIYQHNFPCFLTILEINPTPVDILQLRKRVENTSGKEWGGRKLHTIRKSHHIAIQHLLSTRQKRQLNASGTTPCTESISLQTYILHLQYSPSLNTI